MARLKRIDCSRPGITRRGRGRGWEYLDERGERIADPEAVERIAGLAVPPAWRDVWISPDPMGHLQATGIDAADRKQYLYHQKWRERRDQEKFDSMIEFARALPLMRRRVARDVQRRGMGRERVLACAVRLLDRGFFRVGGESYAADNESYGLATIGKRHVKLGEDRLEFDYPSKAEKRRIHQSVVDDDVRDVIAALKRRRQGIELLAYKDGRGWVDVKSADINAYVKEVSGGDFSAKDFRTWNATVMAAVALAVSAQKATGSKTGRKRAETRAIKEVAGYLGNTPAVSRASYIDPRVFDRYRSGLTVSGVLTQVGDSGDVDSLHGPVEDAVLDLLAGSDSPAIEEAAA